MRIFGVTTYAFSYGAFGLTQQVKAGSYTLASYTYYDGNKNLEKLTYNNNATEEYKYDSQGRVAKETYKESASGIGTDVIYTYDARENITAITYTVGTNTYNISYVYDAANQLIREHYQLAGSTWVMTYDNAGNMLTRKKYSYTTGPLNVVASFPLFRLKPEKCRP